MHLDYETYCEIDVRRVGSSRYSRHPSNEILIAAWSLNDIVQPQWVPSFGMPVPRDFEEAINSPDVVKYAWNAPFEINETRRHIGPVDVRQWRDTMVMALACSLPGKLEKVPPILRLREDQYKQKSGTRLINKFSNPRKPTKNDPRTRNMWWDYPDDWDEFCDYCGHDEIAERGIFHKLAPYDLPEHEWEMWHIDQEINYAGIPINMDMVRNAIRIIDYVKADRKQKMREITGLENPNSGTQLLPWLQDNGYFFEDLQKPHIKTALTFFDEEPEYWEAGRWEEYRANDDLREVLELRLEAAKTSVTKYNALERAVDEDGLLRYAFQMAGAGRTWRWAGRIWQPQNLPRPEKWLEKDIEIHARNVEELNEGEFDIIYHKPMDVLASCIRSAAQAPPGMMFFDADLNAIENRILGWLAGCQKILSVFERGMDPYVAFAVYLFGEKYSKLMDEYKDGDASKRTVAKPGVLGCGYMLGPGKRYLNHKTGEMEATGLLGYAWNMGITDFTLEQSELSVETFRREFFEVKEYWYALERAAKKCIRTGRETSHGHISFDRKGPFMRMNLPSGRSLHYLRPRLEMCMMPWGKEKMAITYEGKNDKDQWVRIQTHPGKLTENADQAIARDVLVHGLRKAHAEGLDLRIHVHDQGTGLAPTDEASDQLQTLIGCMSAVPVWAKGLPLATEGEIMKMFKKV